MEEKIMPLQEIETTLRFGDESRNLEIRVTSQLVCLVLGKQFDQAEAWFWIENVPFRVNCQQKGNTLEVSVDGGGSKFWEEEDGPRLRLTVEGKQITAAAAIANIDENYNWREGPETLEIPLGSLRR